jgi:hypothetical protein
LLIYLLSRESLWPAAVWMVIVLNALWTADSFLIVATGWISPNLLGYAFVTAQALGVVVKANKDSAAGVMPSEGLFAYMAAYHTFFIVKPFIVTL